MYQPIWLFLNGQTPSFGYQGTKQEPVMESLSRVQLMTQSLFDL